MNWNDNTKVYPSKKWTHDMIYLRTEINRLEKMYRESGERVADGSLVLTQLVFEQKVQFVDGEKIISSR